MSHDKSNQSTTTIDQTIKSLEYELRMRTELPHLFLHPLYKWQREFVKHFVDVKSLQGHIDEQIDR